MSRTETVARPCTGMDIRGVPTSPNPRITFWHRLKIKESLKNTFIVGEGWGVIKKKYWLYNIISDDLGGVFGQNKYSGAVGSLLTDGGPQLRYSCTVVIAPPLTYGSMCPEPHPPPWIPEVKWMLLWEKYHRNTALCHDSLFKLPQQPTCRIATKPDIQVTFTQYRKIGFRPLAHF